jgi:hypothetical protein
VRLEELLEEQTKTTPPPAFSEFPDDEPPTVRLSAPFFPVVNDVDDLPPPSAELREVLITPLPPPPPDPVRYVVAAIWALTLTVFGGLAYAVLANG